MTDAQLTARIVKDVKVLPWREIVAMGINAQQAQKIRAGKPVMFRERTLVRLRAYYDARRNKAKAS